MLTPLRHTADLAPRSPLAWFYTSKMKAAEAAKVLKSGREPLAPAASFTPCGALGAVASPPHQFGNDSGSTRGLEKAALCHAGFKASLGLGWAPCSTQHLSNIRSTAFIKREFTSKIGFARLSAEGGTIRR